MSGQKPVRFSEHVVTTIKLAPDRDFMGSDNSPGIFRQKVVRIILTDADATDSSDNDDEPILRRVKRHVERIKFESALGLPKQKKTKRRSLKRLASPESGGSGRKKFRGVRQRPWGRWAAEIRDPTLRKRVWLGTFDTAEEAASVYDRAAVMLKGPDAVTNFPKPCATESTTLDDNLREIGGEGESSCPNDGASSPTSVLRVDGLRPFDWSNGGVDYFGFEFDMTLTAPEITIPGKHGAEEFDEFDSDYFLVEPSNMANEL